MSTQPVKALTPMSFHCSLAENFQTRLIDSWFRALLHPTQDLESPRDESERGATERGQHPTSKGDARHRRLSKVFSCKS